ncbi:MAG: pilus assembly protein PilP [bacterium]
MIFKTILLVLLFILLTDGFVSAQQKIKESNDIILEDSNNGPVSESLPKRKENESVVNSISRDPFYRMLDQLGWDNTAITDYELNDLVLIGVVWDVPRPIAMFKAPKERRFIVRVGEKIGKNNGRVMHIGRGEVGVRETYMDISGNKTEKSTIKRVEKGPNGGLNG